MVSILLVCQPGLGQISLFTIVSAVPQAKVVAKAEDADTALHLAQQLQPDVLLVDAIFLQDEVFRLLKQIKKKHLKIICVVLTSIITSSRNAALFQEGADFVVYDRNPERELPLILEYIQTYQRNRPSN